MDYLVEYAKQLNDSNLENQKLEEENKKLKEQIKILLKEIKDLQYAQEFVDWSSVFRCKHCHHYSLQGYKCHHCGKDPYD